MTPSRSRRSFRRISSPRPASRTTGRHPSTKRPRPVRLEPGPVGGNRLRVPRFDVELVIDAEAAYRPVRRAEDELAVDKRDLGVEEHASWNRIPPDVDP